MAQDKPNNALSGKHIAALVDDYFEQVELTGPRAEFELAGAQVDIVSRNPMTHGMRHHEAGDTFTTDVALGEADPDKYDAVLLPGGVANGDSLRMVPEAQRFVRKVVEQGKPVAVICHGGWLLMSSGLVRNRTLTSWPTLQDDYRNAGAHWVDQEVVVDGNWVSSRKPDDIPAFSRAVIEVIGRKEKERRAA